MKRTALAILIALTPLPSFADAQADATYIVEQTVNRAIFEGALTALRPVILSAVENDLRQSGIVISDIGGYMDITMDEFMEGYVAIMQEKSVPHFLNTFSPDDLANIAAFYATPAGQSLISQTPALMQFGATAGASAGQEAFLEARGRVRQRLIDEAIDVTNGDKSMMQKLLDALK